MFDLMTAECDELVYRIAFSCERSDEENDLIILDNKYTVYLMVDLFVDKLKTVAKEVEFHLSTLHRSNFRYAVAKTKGPNGFGYKAGRGDRPYHYYTVRNYFIKQYGAKEIEGYEADDALGFKGGDHSSQGVVLCHQDKDINMIPGWHYNYVLDTIYRVDEGLGTLELSDDRKKLVGKGLYQFYAQLLTGDRTDNIPGIKGLGPVKVYGLLRDGRASEECLSTVKLAYKDQYKDNWKEVLFEIADLVWICRKPDQTGRQYLQSLGV